MRKHGWKGSPLMFGAFFAYTLPAALLGQFIVDALTARLPDDDDRDGVPVDRQERRATALGLMARHVLGHEPLPTANQTTGGASKRKADIIIHLDGNTLADPTTSHWLKQSLNEALARDSVDAANDAHVLFELLAHRSEEDLRAAAHAVAGIPETTMAVRFADGRASTLDVSQARHTIITGDN